jgi:hypothetical protein
MSKTTREPQSDKDCYLLAAETAAGDLPNDKVKNCHVCKDHGLPHESIEIHKVNGRLRSDGTYDVRRYDLIDYYTGRQHQYKQQYDQRAQGGGGYYKEWDLEAMLR